MTRLCSIANILHSGIRIKATEGDTGEITGVTYSGITLSSISKYAEPQYPYHSQSLTNR